MWSYLINNIELYSNHKSFSLGIDTVRNLWLLLHFKNLEIKNKTIYYQVDNGIRQRKNTKHPIRKMRKVHKNTAELIEYLSNKPYKIIQLELEFINGWKIKQRPCVELEFHTNSTTERDDLINKLLNIAGQGPIDVSQLDFNYLYYFKSETELKKIDLDGLPSPDEFWSEEQLAQWKKDYDRINRVYENEQSKGVLYDNSNRDRESFIDFKFLDNENSTPF
jgi:hypothetical protein